MSRFAATKKGRWYNQPWSLMAGLAGPGSMLLVGVIYFSYYIPLTPGRMTRASTALFSDLSLWQWLAARSLPFADDAAWVAAGLIVIGSAMFMAYGLAVFVSWKRQAAVRSLRLVVGLAASMFVISTFALPNLNTDIFNYITRARLSTVHDSNPHYVPASDFPDDAVYPYASKKVAQVVGDKLALWTWLSIPLAKVAGDSPTANLLIFRTAFLLFNLANIWLIYAILNRMAPKQLLAGLILYAWNPIVLVLGQSKTDTVMVFFLLLGVLLLIQRLAHLAAAAWAASVLIKLVTLPLVAIYWVRELWLRNWKVLAVSLLSFAVVVLVTNWPLWQGPELLRNHFLVGLGEAGASTIKSGMQKKILLFLTGGGLLVAVGLTRDDSHLTLIRRWAVIMLFFALFLSRFSHAWYLMTPIAVVALSKEWRISSLMIALTYSAFMVYVWSATSTRSFQLPSFFDQSRLVMFMIPVVVVILLTSGLTIAKRVSTRKSVVTT